MITRIVKMTLKEGEQFSFEAIFNQAQPDILKFEGCTSVTLQKDTVNPTVYFTISQWVSADALDNYRSSDFFRSTWASVKPMFAERAEAWSLNAIIAQTA